MSGFFRLKKIDAQLHEITGRISFMHINPINLYDEQEKVLADPDYNPQFRYSELPFDPDKVQEALDAIDQNDSVLGEILEHKRRIALDKIDMLANRGNRKFSIYSRKAYGLPSDTTLKKAAELLLLDSDKEDKTVMSKNALHVLKSELIHYGFDYHIAEKEMSATASVLVSTKKMFLKKDYPLSPNYVKRLIVHEIGTHVLRAENGREQPFKIFMHGFPNYLVTEEGLAVYNEERFGLMLNENLRNYAARAMAVKMAQTGSFASVYNHLRQFFGDQWAFRLASRVKRGLEDTEKPGGATRDYAYIEGYLKVKGFLASAEPAKNNNGPLKQLYYGKIGLEHVDKLKEIPGLVQPKFLPKNQTFKSLLSF
ncbi:TPA: DUF1704 domain-containing protein [Candidatus Woesearchaeota archaeon]|nr:DUF1704 domain-containing protein [Candidatus Woesearchaeota archaeon]